MLPAFESVGFPLLNCDATHWWKVLELLSAMSLSHPELYIAKIRSQAANPKSEIWGMSRPSLLPRGLCLMKVAILWREHAMFLALPSKTSTVLNKEIELKLPSHSVGSAGWLARYGMAEGSRLGGGGYPRGLRRWCVLQGQVWSPHFDRGTCCFEGRWPCHQLDPPTNVGRWDRVWCPVRRPYRFVQECAQHNWLPREGKNPWGTGKHF